MERKKAEGSKEDGAYFLQFTPELPCTGSALWGCQRTTDAGLAQHLSTQKGLDLPGLWLFAVWCREDTLHMVRAMQGK